ncbi:unnamed protein product [Adineta steineri]|uniref:ethanolamine kinase n=1 Tax=Adineta steineri TaxID=433720 RepID=A0A815S919_9BILA|nr:unnamed protein product [Adineta steineri]CAF1485028.1 unnamed protein product [Adineta steineri]
MTQCLVSSTTLSITSLSTDIYPLIASLRPDWSPHNTHLRQLTGGINNTAFGLFNNLDQSDALVIKIFGLHTEVFIDRNVELNAISILSKYELAQPILLQFNNGIIYKFIPGKICSRDDIRDINIASFIALQMAQYHSIPLRNHKQKPCLIPLIRKILSLISDSKNPPAEFISLSSDVDWIEKDVLSQLIPDPQYGIDLVFCHNDLACTNILYNSLSQSVSFIDFEYCTVNYALFDVANHFVEYAGYDQIDFDRYPKKDEQYRWLKIYFEARNLKFENQEKIYHLINQFAALSHLCYGLWALAQVSFARADSDYASYSQRRLNRYRELKVILFNKWLPQ